LRRLEGEDNPERSTKHLRAKERGIQLKQTPGPRLNQNGDIDHNSKPEASTS